MLLIAYLYVKIWIIYVAKLKTLGVKDCARFQLFHYHITNYHTSLILLILFRKDKSFTFKPSWFCLSSSGPNTSGTMRVFLQLFLSSWFRVIKIFCLFQIYHKVLSPSHKEIAEKRFEFFVNKVLKTLSLNVFS